MLTGRIYIEIPLRVLRRVFLFSVQVKQQVSVKLLEHRKSDFGWWIAQNLFNKTP